MVTELADVWDRANDAAGFLCLLIMYGLIVVVAACAVTGIALVVALAVSSFKKRRAEKRAPR